MKRLLPIILVFISLTGFSQSAVLTTGSPSYTQNFDSPTLPTSGNVSWLDNSTIPYWYASSNNLAANGLVAANGSSSTGNLYNFGTTSATDRALGSLASGSTLTIYYGLLISNASAAPITSLRIQYTGEQWRNGGNPDKDTLAFSYSVTTTSVNSGTYTSFSALDFVTPIATSMAAALDGNAAANRVVFDQTITGLNIAQNSTIMLRWVDINDAGNDHGMAIDDITITATFATISTDYYRSAASGNWNSLSTWESSADNITWAAATVLPDNNSNTITIRNGHTVTLTTGVTADQLVIESGGILQNALPASNVFTIANGSGDDMDIKSGGVYLVTSSENYSNNFSLSSGAVVRVESGGTIKIGNGGAVGGGNSAYGSTATSFVWENNSTFQWNSTTVPGIQTTFFPDAGSSIIPVFKFTASPSLPIGGSTYPTIVYGRLEATAAVSFTGTQTKTFRNGIINSAQINGSTSGKFIINGANADLGGTGTIITPTAGLEIGSSSLVILGATKSITGNIYLLSNSYIELGAYTLTVSGSVSGGSTNSFIKTNGSGLLKLDTVGTKIFPVGYITYNPITISNSSTATDFSVRVENGINPSIANPFGAMVNRTWTINSSATTGVTLTFQFSSGDYNASFNPSSPAEIGQYFSAWNIMASGIPIAGSNPYTVTTSAISSFNTPFIIGNNGAILPINYFISCQAKKENYTAVISWNVGDCAETDYFELQRSINNSTFQTIGSVRAAQTTQYSLADQQPAAGNNLYRIKVFLKNGQVKFSNVVSVIFSSPQIYLVSITPNPAGENAMLTIASGKATVLKLLVINAMGREIRIWVQNVQDGTNRILLPLHDLSQGIYFLRAEANGQYTNILKFVKD
ncbi:MAG: hypothetical protein C4308_09065 [Chitinophagaceae bacterium]